MNTAIENYINDISGCKLDLANALIGKGADVSTDDSLSYLVERVAGLHSGVTKGAITLSTSQNEIELNNLPFIPIKIGLAARELIVNTPISSSPYIVMCSYEETGGTVYNNENAVTSPELILTSAEKTVDGKKLYDIKITAPITNKFKAYYEYSWVACSKGFEFV